ncbi:MAG: HAMP domain-containing histidine kinase [Clostridia bacterium]|nr:HAMP domain-containing histidine kinase [Clostridia bacterium]
MKKEDKLSRIEASLMKLQEGNIYEPIKEEGVGVYRAITRRLETLRLTLVKTHDIETEGARRNNMAIASVAHDMKTPLTIIAGYAECMSDGMNDKDYPALILQKTEQMNNMVLGIIDESHNTYESQTSQKTLSNARQYFAEAFERLIPVAEKKGIQLKIKRAPNAQIRIDSYQFGRVLQNLITNAIKYSAAGTTIKVSFRLWAKTLRISVKDQGIGISKESLPFIFDQFYTEDKTRSDSSSNGLGLYITKEIVRAHGGDIVVASKKGKGSTFTVVLPVEPDIDEKITLTGKFDKLRLWQKLSTELFFGWLMASLYRIVRFFETRNTSTLMFGLLCIALFPFAWMIDFLSICVYGRIAFLAD